MGVRLQGEHRARERNRDSGVGLNEGSEISVRTGMGWGPMKEPSGGEADRARCGAGLNQKMGTQGRDDAP